jgi:preprotein translocase subunit SecG
MGFLITLHIMACLSLILIVLLQAGKGMGSLFGGGESFFGSLGPAGFLKKLTVAAAVIFILTSLSLALLSGRKGSSLIKKEVVEEEKVEEEKTEEEKVEKEEAPAPFDKD